jgi:hypothetical protein
MKHRKKVSILLHRIKRNKYLLAIIVLQDFDCSVLFRDHTNMESRNREIGMKMHSFAIFISENTPVDQRCFECTEQ